MNSNWKDIFGPGSQFDYRFVKTYEETAERVKALRQLNQKIVLTMGTFDILHIGHIEFLEKAKKQGHYLFILLESDESIRKLKGKNRPFNSYEDRAKLLAGLETVNYIILLPEFKNEQYDKLIKSLKPDTIATTKGDPARHHKERQAKMVNAKLIDVIGKISNQSTSRLVKILKKDHWL